MTIKKGFNFLKQRSKSCHISKEYLKHIKSIPILSFGNIREKDFYALRRFFIDEFNIKLSRSFPINTNTQQIIENNLEGIYLGDCIYINDKKSTETIASSIIHELDHHINGNKFKNVKEMELNAFLMEWYFQNPDKRFTRKTKRNLMSMIDQLY